MVRIGIDLLILLVLIIIGFHVYMYFKLKNLHDYYKHKIDELLKKLNNDK